MPEKRALANRIGLKSASQIVFVQILINPTSPSLLDGWQGASYSGCPIESACTRGPWELPP